MVAIVRKEQADAFAESTRRGYLTATGVRAEIYPVRAAQGAGVLPWDGIDAGETLRVAA
jgi:galactokinase